jgi:peptidoglycan/LPS O-acetylase OafA/YrhL
LDSLRCIAIFAVFLVHFRPPFRPAYDVFGLGWMGVDLFFAISGFLITTILFSLRAAEHPFRVFYWRRTLRIFPPYFLVLGLLWLVNVLHHEPRFAYFYQAPFFVSSINTEPFRAIYLHLSHRFGYVTAPLPIDNHVYYHISLGGVGVFWSLSIEELFYLLWAPLVLLASRRKIVIFALVPILLCPIFRFLGHTRECAEYTNFFARLDSLAMGACVALVLRSMHKGLLPAGTVKRMLGAGFVLSSTALLWMVWRDGGFRGIEIRSLLSFSVFGFSLLAAACSCLTGLCVCFSGQAASCPAAAQTSSVSRNDQLYDVPHSYSCLRMHLQSGTSDVGQDGTAGDRVRDPFGRRDDSDRHSLLEVLRKALARAEGPEIPYPGTLEADRSRIIRLQHAGASS